MHPVATFTVSFYQQLIKVLLTIISCIEQDGRITDGLLHTYTSDIHSAARQVIT